MTDHLAEAAELADAMYATDRLLEIATRARTHAAVALVQEQRLANTIAAYALFPPDGDVAHLIRERILQELGLDR